MYKHLAVGATAAVLLVASGAFPAHAAEPIAEPDDLGAITEQFLRGDTMPPASQEFTVTEAGANSLASKYVQCTTTVDSVHPSAKTGNTEYKTRVTCVGHGWDIVHVRVKGGIFFYPSSCKACFPGKQQTRATSSQVQPVRVNGDRKTYYTPGVGKTAGKGKGKGFWFGTSTAQAISPQQSAVAVASRQVWMDIK